MGVIKDLLRNIEDIAFETMGDAEKFESGNNVAGVRVRKAMQSVKSIAQTVRVEVSRIKKERKEE